MDRLIKSVSPLGLDAVAARTAASYGDKGGIVITLGTEGVRIGAAGLTPDELRKALCMAIHCTYLQAIHSKPPGRKGPKEFLSEVESIDIATWTFTD